MSKRQKKEPAQSSGRKRPSERERAVKGRLANGRRAPSYDRELAERIRKVLYRRRNVGEKEMFGGIAFLVRGKMFCGIAKGELMVRVGPARHDEALGKPHVRPMDFTGRPMKGYVFVAPQGLRTEKSLRSWVERGFEFASALDR